MFYTFFIQDLYTTTTIQEPRGWKDLFNVLDRDFSTHGVFFKYTDQGLKLGFICEGKDLLEEAYQETGTETFYQFGVIESVSEEVEGTQIFLGDIDFETRNLESDYFNAEIRVIDTLSKLKNRSKLETSFNRQLTHDGTVVSKLNSTQVALLATKEYKQLILVNNGATDTATSVVGTDESQMFGQVGFDQTDSTEIEKYTELVTQLTPIQGDLFLTLSKATDISFQIEYDLDVTLTETQGSGTTEYLIRFYIVPDRTPKDGILPLYVLESELVSSASPYNYSTTYYGFKDTASGSPIAGQYSSGTQWFFGIFVEMTSTGNTQFSLDWDVRYIRLVATDHTAQIGTVSKTYQIHDALNKTLNYITDEYDFLYSELLGDEIRGYSEDGCLSTMHITNGFRVRRILDDDKAPIESFKGFVENLDAPGAIGYGIEEIESPTFIYQTSQSTSTWVFMPDNTQINIVGVDLTSDILAGDTIYFYNSDEIWGAFDVDASVEVLGNTILGVTERSDADSIKKDTIFNDVVIYSNRTTEVRERLRLEEWEHFYGDEELIDLGDVEEYIEEPFDDILYNKFDLGFKKLSNDEDKPTTLEDFETRSSWELPLKRSDKILSRVMNWIMSTFLINESRQTIFNEKPTTSHKLDNDIFAFDVEDLKVNDIISYVHNVSSDDEIIVSDHVYENYIREEGVFTIFAVASGNAGTYQYYPDRVLHNVAQATYTIPVWQTVSTYSNELVTIQGYISIEDDGVYEGSTFYAGIKAEANEKLDSSTNISGPEYAYNQRRTQKRFLIRWGRFINSVLGYISDVTQTIQNLFYINNGDFTTELNVSTLSGCLQGDNSASAIREADNITTDNFPQAKFKPNIISCTVEICDDDYDYIVNAHKNVMPYGQEDQAYGYLSLTNPKDETKQMWLLSMKRSPVDRIAKVRGVERLIPPSNAYNFSGIEKVTISGIPTFERTQTFYYKGYFKNAIGSDIFYLWSNITATVPFTGLRIYVYNDTFTANENKVGIILQGSSGGSITVFSTAIVTPESGLNKIEVTYDGSSSASGITILINDVDETGTIVNDNLTQSTVNNTGASIGLNLNNDPSAGNGILKSSEFWIDSVNEFAGECVNNGDDTMTDTSGQGNDGSVDRSTSTEEEFYIFI